MKPHKIRGRDTGEGQMKKGHKERGRETTRTEMERPQSTTEILA
jgi:hypothetical protein